MSGSVALGLAGACHPVSLPTLCRVVQVPGRMRGPCRRHSRLAYGSAYAHTGNSDYHRLLTPCKNPVLLSLVTSPGAGGEHGNEFSEAEQEL